MTRRTEEEEEEEEEEEGFLGEDAEFPEAPRGGARLGALRLASAGRAPEAPEAAAAVVAAAARDRALLGELTDDEQVRPASVPAARPAFSQLAPLTQVLYKQMLKDALVRSFQARLPPPPTPLGARGSARRAHLHHTCVRENEKGTE